MSASAVKDKVVDDIFVEKYDLIVVNFANTDMVGHTGNFRALIQAVEVAGQCFSEIAVAVDKIRGTALIKADPGNSEQIWDRNNEVPHTQHMMNLVPLIL
jgi:2,3-bisphosphoglycerate-independent phosphoglycerate mutase